MTTAKKLFLPAYQKTMLLERKVCDLESKLATHNIVPKGQSTKSTQSKNKQIDSPVMSITYNSGIEPSGNLDVVYENISDTSAAQEVINKINMLKNKNIQPTVSKIVNSNTNLINPHQLYNMRPTSTIVSTPTTKPNQIKSQSPIKPIQMQSQPLNQSPKKQGGVNYNATYDVFSREPTDIADIDEGTTTFDFDISNLLQKPKIKDVFSSVSDINSEDVSQSGSRIAALAANSEVIKKDNQEFKNLLNGFNKTKSETAPKTRNLSQSNKKISTRSTYSESDLKLDSDEVRTMTETVVLNNTFSVDQISDIPVVGKTGQIKQTASPVAKTGLKPKTKSATKNRTQLKHRKSSQK
jgi:hypothetical protein